MPTNPTPPFLPHRWDFIKTIAGMAATFALIAFVSGFAWCLGVDTYHYLQSGFFASVETD